VRIINILPIFTKLNLSFSLFSNYLARALQRLTHSFAYTKDQLKYKIPTS